MMCLYDVIELRMGQMLTAVETFAGKRVLPP